MNIHTKQEWCIQFMYKVNANAYTDAGRCKNWNKQHESCEYGVEVKFATSLDLPEVEYIQLFRQMCLLVCQQSWAGSHRSRQAGVAVYDHLELCVTFFPLCNKIASGHCNNTSLPTKLWCICRSWLWWTPNSKSKFLIYNFIKSNLHYLESSISYRTYCWVRYLNIYIT